jgi:HEAT repeat protein
MLYHVVTNRLERRQQRQHQTWLKIWGKVLLEDAPPPPKPLPEAALSALTGLMEILKGEEKRQLQTLVRDYGIDRRWCRRLNAYRINTRIKSLENLALAELPETLPDVLKKLDDAKAPVRHMAARAAASILAGSEAQRQAVQDFVDALCKAELPLGILDEALVLTGAVAGEVVSYMLSLKTLPRPMLQAAIRTAGRQRLLEIVPTLLYYMNDPAPEMRAAVLSTFSQLGYLPPPAQDFVLRSAFQQEEKVRIQAVRALALVPAEQSHTILWLALTDASWWVKRAAGEALVHQGEAGLELLRIAATKHPDRYAADTAVQFLLDHTYVRDLQSEEWIWART